MTLLIDGGCYAKRLIQVQELLPTKIQQCNAAVRPSTQCDVTLFAKQELYHCCYQLVLFTHKAVEFLKKLNSENVCSTFLLFCASANTEHLHQGLQQQYDPSVRSLQRLRSTV